MVSEATDGPEAVAKAQKLKPDVVVMDINLPGMDGLEAAKQIKEHCPDTSVVVITAYDDERRMFDAIQAGVTGYVLKDDDPEMMTQAIRNAAEGKAFLPPSITQRVLNGLSAALGGGGASTNKSVTPLSSRELTVLRHMAQGMHNREVATELCISERTVGNHITNIYNKLGVDDPPPAVVYAIKKGIVRV